MGPLVRPQVWLLQLPWVQWLKPRLRLLQMLQAQWSLQIQMLQV